MASPFLLWDPNPSVQLNWVWPGGTGVSEDGGLSMGVQGHPGLSLGTGVVGNPICQVPQLPPRRSVGSWHVRVIRATWLVGRGLREGLWRCCRHSSQDQGQDGAMGSIICPPIPWSQPQQLWAAGPWQKLVPFPPRRHALARTSSPGPPAMVDLAAAAAGL